MRKRAARASAESSATKALYSARADNPESSESQRIAPLRRHTVPQCLNPERLRSAERDIRMEGQFLALDAPQTREVMGQGWLSDEHHIEPEGVSGAALLGIAGDERWPKTRL